MTVQRGSLLFGAQMAVIGAMAGRRSGHLLAALLLRCSPISHTALRSCSDSAGPGPNQKKLAHRLSAVVDAVNERRLPPELRGRANAVRSEADIANVVEQRIWRYMEEGQFENLPGKGKPLKQLLSGDNPHADPAEDTLYRVLSRSGCAPEWIELNKEIRGLIAAWRSALARAWSSGPRCQWQQQEGALMAQMKHINTKVLRYNLIVPFGRQMCGLNWDKEIAKLHQNKPH